MYIKKNIKFLKMIKDVSTEEIGEKTGLGKTFNNYYVGKNIPPLDALIAIAEYFDVTLDELVRKDLSELAFQNSLKVEEPRANYGFDIKLARMERAVQDLQEEVFKKSPGDPKK